ncbi:hypothetical protein P7C71_g2151, partial [Lecanoromycetidae sp. Uapishka_2]
MAEIGIIASVIGIAEVGFKLSTSLYTFGVTVASADRSIIAISKDVSLTSSVMKELGDVLQQDHEANAPNEKEAATPKAQGRRIASANAIGTADQLIHECKTLFEEMDRLLVDRLPHLSAAEGDQTKKAILMLERLKWPRLQLKLQVVRGNLDRLKSTLLLMLHVLILGKLMAERHVFPTQRSGDSVRTDNDLRTKVPSAVTNQRALIEHLQQSNEDYIRKFERLQLDVQDRDVKEDRVFQNSVAALPPYLGGVQTTFFPNHSSSRKSTGDARAMRSLARDTVAPTEAMSLEDTVLLNLLFHYNRLFERLIGEVHAKDYDIATKSRSRIEYQIKIARSNELEIQLEKTTSHRVQQSIEAMISGQSLEAEPSPLTPQSSEFSHGKATAAWHDPYLPTSIEYSQPRKRGVIEYGRAKRRRPARPVSENTKTLNSDNSLLKSKAVNSRMATQSILKGDIESEICPRDKAPTEPTPPPLSPLKNIAAGGDQGRAWETDLSSGFKEPETSSMAPLKCCRESSSTRKESRDPEIVEGPVYRTKANTELDPYREQLNARDHQTYPSPPPHPQQQGHPQQQPQQQLTPQQTAYLQQITSNAFEQLMQQAALKYGSPQNVPPQEKQAIQQGAHIAGQEQMRKAVIQQQQQNQQMQQMQQMHNMTHMQQMPQMQQMGLNPGQAIPYAMSFSYSTYNQGDPRDSPASGLEHDALERPRKPQCWDHSCNGRSFSSISNLLRHQGEKGDIPQKLTCHRCAAEFTRKAALGDHLILGECKARSSKASHDHDEDEPPPKRQKAQQKSTSVGNGEEGELTNLEAKMPAGHPPNKIDELLALWTTL